MRVYNQVGCNDHVPDVFATENESSKLRGFGQCILIFIFVLIRVVFLFCFLQCVPWNGRVPGHWFQ